MDCSIEIIFVKTYIKKEYQERLAFELQSKKHRQKAISRFSHDSNAILNDCFRRSNTVEIQELIREKKDVKEKCYVISDDEHDGKMLPLYEAVGYCMASYTAMILISNKFILVKEEVEGAPIFYLSK